MKMEGKRPLYRNTPIEMEGHYTRRGMKAWNIREEWAPTEKGGNVSARPATPHMGTAAKGEKGEKYKIFCVLDSG